MRAGALRHRLAIQVATETDDDAGEPIPSWATVYTVDAEIARLAGSELLTAQQVFGSATHRITTRYVSGITTKHRGLFGSRVFDFQSVENVEERNRLLTIVALERGV